jgi:hypothetical protein
VIEQIYTSHWRSSLLKDADAQMVSISRGEPRWRLPFAYRRMRSLAPSDHVWAREDQESFEAAYLDQLASLGADRVLSDLARIAGDHAAILLCWERPDEPFCHRWALSCWLHARAGIEVPELEPGMLPQRPDVPAPRLF